MQKQKPNYRPLFFTVILCLVATAALVYFTRGEAQTTKSIVKLSYFKNNSEFAETIQKSLQSEISKQKYFWIGYEPENQAQIELSHLIKQEIEKQNGAFDVVIVDKELTLNPELQKSFAVTHEIPLKENFAEVAELITTSKDKKILVITAAIYSSNFILANPHAKVKEITQMKPFVLSLGFFPLRNDDERKTVFSCDTEDKTGTSPWACGVINKARSVRRRIDLNKLNESPAPRIGLMDLTGETDYMVLVGK